MATRQFCFTVVLSLVFCSGLIAQSIVVSGASNSAYNGTYTYATMWNGKKLYAKGSYAIQWKSSYWAIGSSGGDIHSHSANTATPPNKGWKNGLGTAYTPSVRLTGDVTAYNNAPYGTDKSISLAANETKTYASGSDFGYSDFDGDAFAGVQITTLETQGNLKYNNLDVSLNQYCADVTLLTYTPGFDESGTPYTSFWFKTYDGTAYCASTYKMTINVSAPVPVELTRFSASASGNAVDLSWTTATEVNNWGFEIERAMKNEEAGIANWETIGFVEGFGTVTSPKEYSYRDDNISPGTYMYRLRQIDRDGQFEYSHTIEVTVIAGLSALVLAQNYPNPFNPATTLEFTLPEDSRVILKVFDVLGREMATLVNGNLEAGVTHRAVFDGSGYESGFYFFRLEAGGTRVVRRMMLVK